MHHRITHYLPVRRESMFLQHSSRGELRGPGSTSEAKPVQNESYPLKLRESSARPIVSPRKNACGCGVSLRRFTLRCKDVKKSMPEPRVALQSNAPRLQRGFPGTYIEFSLF